MYASITQVKNYILRDITSAFEATVTEFIGMAGKYIDNICNRSFDVVGSTPATKYYDGNDSDSLEIDDLHSLTALTVFDVGFDVSSLALYPANETPKTLIKIKSTYAPQSASSRQPVFLFDRGEQNIAVTGIWGYGTEVPKDITLACLKIVAAIIKENFGQGDANEITSESIGDYSVNYEKVSEIAGALQVDELLKPYRRAKVGTNRTGILKL